MLCFPWVLLRDGTESHSDVISKSMGQKPLGTVIQGSYLMLPTLSPKLGGGDTAKTL